MTRLSNVIIANVIIAADLMSVSPLAYAAPLVATLASAAALRALAGPDRTAQYVGATLPFGFLLVWAFVVAPGWGAHDALGRIGHIVFGGMLFGLVLDVMQPKRILSIVVAVIFLLGSAWAEANGGLWPDKPGGMVFLQCVALLALGCGLLWRIDRLRDETSDGPFASGSVVTLVLLTMLAFALASVASADHVDKIAQTSMLLAFAFLGFLAWTWIARAPLPDAAALSATGGVLAIAWALMESSAATLPGLFLAGLILFADGTADRVTLPRAGVSRVLYPLLLAAVALLPLALAAAITLALHEAV